MADGVGHGPSRRRRTGRRRARTRRRTIVLVAVLFVLAGLGAVAAVSLLAAADYTQTLPRLEDYRPSELNENSVVFARDGTPLEVIANDRNRTAVPLWKISKFLQDATVAIEDRRFYEHRGVDYEGIGRAAWKDITAGEIREGASTLTMQLISQRYITKERTFDRKVKEAWLAIQLEKETPKEKILEQYLNTIFYGRNAYGVEAASRTYFSRTARNLTLAQAALLAGLAQLPSSYDPLTYPERARRRRNEVLDAMGATGKITAAQWRRARAAGLQLKPNAKAYGRDREPFVVSYVTSLLDKDKKFGAARVREGGLRVRTTIDLALQRQAERAMAAVLHNPGDPAAAVVTIDPKTGDILALASTQRFDKAQYNLATQGKRQPGSTFKPMTLAAAIEMGINPQATRYLSKRFVCRYPEDAEIGCPFGGWDVNTADESPTGGPVTLYSATLASDNTVYAQLAIDVGADKIKNMAERLGITSELDEVVSLTLGAEDVTPLELTSAYATLAANGVYRTPRIMTEIRRGKKTVLAKYGTKAYRTLGAGVAYEVNRILSDNATSGTGIHARTTDGRPQAGKTGTTDRSVDAWYCGYTPELATCVWVGYPNLTMIDGRAQLREMHDIEGLNGPYANVYGGTLPSEIWHQYMDEALEDEPPTAFPEPSADRRVVWLPFRSPWTKRAEPPPKPPKPAPPAKDEKDKDKDKDGKDAGTVPGDGTMAPTETLPTEGPPATTTPPADPPPATTTPPANPPPTDTAPPAPAGEAPPTGTGVP